MSLVSPPSPDSDEIRRFQNKHMKYLTPVEMQDEAKLDKADVNVILYKEDVQKCAAHNIKLSRLVRLLVHRWIETNLGL